MLHEQEKPRMKAPRLAVNGLTSPKPRISGRKLWQQHQLLTSERAEWKGT